MLQKLPPLKKQYILFLFFLWATLNSVFSQNSATNTLSLRDFAIWGGSSNASQYNAGQNVSIRNNSLIEGNIGSNHFLTLGNNINLKGNIVSGNGVRLGINGRIEGNISALRTATDFAEPSIFIGVNHTIIGNLTANGRIEIPVNRTRLTTITGTVSVNAPTQTNYSGPVPSGGINNTVQLPKLPEMPDITPFDNLTGTQNITASRVITPGVYRDIQLRGNQTITFDGPGNYVFERVMNSGRNNTLVFNLKNTTEGTINILVKGQANFANTTVRAINGDFASRIFTEVHEGIGVNPPAPATVAFQIQAPPNDYATGEYLWLGEVYAPYGGISVMASTRTIRPRILGALWSGRYVDVRENVSLTYIAPAKNTVTFIDPYYAPPSSGKVGNEDNLIGAELTSLANNPAPITTIPDNEIFIIDNNTQKVAIEVVSKEKNDAVLKAELIALGMTDIIDNGPHEFIITGYFPIQKLKQLNTNSRIEYVRPLYPPFNNRGQVTTQGDATMRTNMVRQLYGLEGNGVKIGVLSDSYNAKSGAQNDIDQGDLPGVTTGGTPNDNPHPVQVLQDLSGKGSDEGRAMLQIIHDIAPKAKLAFRTGFLSAGDFARGIKELADPALPDGKCDVIVDDLTYITEPFLKDGIVARTVSDVVKNNGITYFTSAGNFGQKSYENQFNGISRPDLFAAPATVHRFGASSADIYQSVSLKPGTYTIVLQWDDSFHSLGEEGVENDLDLYLFGPTGFRLFGFNRSNLFKDPFEVCPFTVTEETVARIMVVRASGSGNVRFKYIIFRGEATLLDYNTGTSTIVGHANSPDAISVGAMLYANIPPFTPIWPGVASFSSRGGTLTLENGTFVTRSKPDIIGPNGVNTTVTLGSSSFNDGDTYPNFFGTSAAAPHAAAAGALIIEGRKKFNEQSAVTPLEVRSDLIASAGKFSHLPPFSFEGGNGFLQADSAIGLIANPKPLLDTIYAEIQGAQNNQESFVVIAKGRYLTPTTQIMVNGVAMTSEVSPDQTEVRAFVPPIPPGDNPPYRLINGAKSPSGLDGGISEPKFFFSGVTNVVIRANNKTRKYGQNNPPFDVEILVNNTPINESGLSASDLGLGGENIVFSTIANSESRPGNYGIFVSRATPLNPEDPLLKQYRFTFINGTLSVEKMPLRITPKNMKLKYGEFPSNIEYTYELENSPDNRETLAEEVAFLHKQYLSGNGLIVLKDFQSQRGEESFFNFENTSFLSSFQSVLNAEKYILENGQLSLIQNDLSPEAIGDQRFLVNVSASSLAAYSSDSLNAPLLQATENEAKLRGLLNLKGLAAGNATARIEGGDPVPLINGQLMSTVSGDLQAIVNGQLRAIVNGSPADVDDLSFLNGQLRALVNGEWLVVSDGTIEAVINNQPVLVDLSVANGQLRAIVNGEEMQLVNGQLRALVNGQLVAMVNGQLRAIVNGQLIPLVNGQLVAMVNGQLRGLVNGQLQALVNGQLFALIDGELEAIEDLTLLNGQLRAIVNGQLRAIVNGQLKAMVNGFVEDVPTTDFSLVNGQLRAIVNGQLRAMVNGQLRAIVNGQLQPLVNGETVELSNVQVMPNGQLRAIVNDVSVPIANGQLRAMVNGQLLGMVNGQLMALVNGELTFSVFTNGQLRALVNGQLQPLVNGQLKAMVNSQLQDVESTSIVNGQLRAIVNGQEWVFPNGQLKALVNGQLQPLVNNFDVSGSDNNRRTIVVVDQDDLLQQSGDLGGMFALPMITGIEPGNHLLIPGAFIHENFSVTYATGNLDITKAPLVVKVENDTKVYGAVNPEFTITYSGFVYKDNPGTIQAPEVFTTANELSGVGTYPLTITGGNSDLYDFVFEHGTLSISAAPLLVKPDNKVKRVGELNPPLTITYTGLVGDDDERSVCFNISLPANPIVFNELERTSTYSNVQLNGQSNVYFANPGEAITLTGTRNTDFTNFPAQCPGCITQIYIGMGNGRGGNTFTECYDVSFIGSWSNDFNIAFNAPAEPGAYYITQRSSWFFNCYQFPINHDAPEQIIGVVIVGESPNNIRAQTIADVDSPVGEYPIILIGCSSYNPNYSVVFEEGTLTVKPECSTKSHRWTGDGTFTDTEGTGNGTPVGEVTADGEPYVGTNSFSFNGNGYITTGTGGSVSGTGDFSVSAWIKTTSENPMVIIQQRDANINGEYILKIGGRHFDTEYNPENAGKAYFFMFDDNNNPDQFDLFSTTLVNDGQWHFIKGERIGVTKNLYVDGVLEATVNTLGVVHLDESIPTFIGSDQRDFASNFDGLIDDVRVSICNEIETFSRKPDAKSSIQLTAEPHGFGKFTEDRIYPNPAQNVIRYRLSEDAISPNAIQILDNSGRIFAGPTQKLGDKAYETNISGLKKGFYFLRAQTSSGIKTLKFVKL